MQFQKLVQQSLIWRGFYFLAVLLLNIVLSRYLRAAGAGWVYFLTNFFSVSVLIGSLNLDSGFTYYSANKSMPFPRLAWFGMCFTIVASLLLVPLFIFYFSNFPIQSVQLADTVCYGLYYTVGIVLCNLFSVLFYTQKNFFAPNFCLGIINYVMAAYLLYLDYTGAPTGMVVTVYFLSFTLQGFLLTIVFFIHYKITAPLQMPSFKELKQLFGYSVVALAANFIFFVVYRIDFWFVEHYRSLDELGNYIQASKMGQMLLILPQILASVVYPQTAEGLNELVIKKNIFIMSRLLIQLYLLLGALAFFFSKYVFVGLFGSSFNLMDVPFLLLLPGIMALSVLTLFSAYFGGSNRIAVNVFGAAIALVFAIMGNFFFTSLYGIIAAAIVSSISYFINLFYSLYIFFKKEKDFSAKDFLAWQMSDYRWVRETLFRG